jgi:hypothetical protein
MDEFRLVFAHAWSDVCYDWQASRWKASRMNFGAVVFAVLGFQGAAVPWSLFTHVDITETLGRKNLSSSEGDLHKLKLSQPLCEVTAVSRFAWLQMDNNFRRTTLGGLPNQPVAARENAFTPE